MAKKVTKKKDTFAQECKQFTIEKLEKAVEMLEGIGAAADDAGMPEVSGRVHSVIEEIWEIHEEAKK